MGIEKFRRKLLVDGQEVPGVPDATSDTPGGVLKAAYVPELDESAELSDVIATVNEIIVALRASGAMEEFG